MIDQSKVGDRAPPHASAKCVSIRMRKGSIDFARVNTEALAALPQLLARWLPDGRSFGREFTALNPHRRDRHDGSFKVNLCTGKWADFATDARGGDPISLVAYLFNIPQGDAARRLAAMLGLDR